MGMAMPTAMGQEAGSRMGLTVDGVESLPVELERGVVVRTE